MKFYTMAYRVSETSGHWEVCDAKTLPDAKRIAIKRHSAGDFDSYIRIGVEEYPGQPDSPIRVITEKSNYPNSVWRPVK